MKSKKQKKEQSEGIKKTQHVKQGRRNSPAPEEEHVPEVGLSTSGLASMISRNQSQDPQGFNRQWQDWCDDNGVSRDPRKLEHDTLIDFIRTHPTPGLLLRQDTERPRMERGAQGVMAATSKATAPPPAGKAKARSEDTEPRRKPSPPIRRDRKSSPSVRRELTSPSPSLSSVSAPRQPPEGPCGHAQARNTRRDRSRSRSSSESR